MAKRPAKPRCASGNAFRQRDEGREPRMTSVGVLGMRWVGEGMGVTKHASP